MLKSPRSSPPHPMIDLATVRETLVYMRDDVRRVPGLESVGQALADAVAEIDKAATVSEPPRRATMLARFLPRSH
ncbi:MAG: hypothetical protein ACT4N2_11865 [Hyphomicrobium sp.]